MTPEFRVSERNSLKFWWEPLEFCGREIYLIGKWFPLWPSMFDNVAKHTIIWSDEEGFRGSEDNGAALAAYPRVNDDNVDGVWREIVTGSTDYKSCLSNILRLDRVANIHNGCFRVDTEDYSLHRGGISILNTKISCQGNYSAHFFWYVELTAKLETKYG